MKRSTSVLFTAVVATAALLLVARAEDVRKPLTAAIFAFEERGQGVKDYGQKISDILFAKLAAESGISLVDRADLAKTLGEQELNLSGMVSPEQAVKVGQMTGAKLLVTGSIVEVDTVLYIIAKIIGTETSQVLGESVQGSSHDAVGPLVEQLAKQVAATIAAKSAQIIPAEVSQADRLATLRKKLGDAKRPAVMVRIEERHVGQLAIDPAAQTEVVLFCKETGFDVADAKAGNERDVGVLVEGEAFSEFGARRGNLVSAKARLEVKAIDRATGKVLAVDRQTAVEVDLTEQIAGKKAIETAAAALAERLLPKLIAK